MSSISITVADSLTVFCNTIAAYKGNYEPEKQNQKKEF